MRSAVKLTVCVLSLLFLPTQVAFADIPDIPVIPDAVVNKTEELDNASPRTRVLWANLAILATLSSIASVYI